MAEVRRLRILHFNQKPAVQDVGLKNRVRAESAGVLLWMLGGLQWLLHKREVSCGSPASRAMLDSFRHGNDPVDSFLRERCVLDPKGDVPKVDLTEAFTDWCEDNGQASDPVKMRSYFYRSLHQRYQGAISAAMRVVFWHTLPEGGQSGGRATPYLPDLGLTCQLSRKSKACWIKPTIAVVGLNPAPARHPFPQRQTNNLP